MRFELSVAVLFSLLAVAPAQAQLEGLALFGFIFPNELSVGVGGVGDLSPSQMSLSINAGLSKVYVRDQWIEPAIEVGIGPTSDVALCREEPRPTPNTCHDGYALGGLRFRPLRESDRVLRPFVHLLLGAYWKGTGLEDPDLLPGTFAIQTGGGIDIRSPASIHGIRVSGDYRHVFDGERGRHQLQFVIAYFLGWRGP